MATPRSLTPRGLRKISGTVALPRETQAAGKVAADIMTRAPELARAQTVDSVEAIIGRQWAESMSDLSIVSDPHTTIRSQAVYMSGAPAALLFGEANILTGAAGAVGPPVVPAVAHNMLRDGEPIRPMLLHSIGMTVGIAGEIGGDLQMLASLCWELRRDKTIIAEGPLLSIMTGFVYSATAAGMVLLEQPKVVLQQNGGGGYELEGHGSIFEKSHHIEFWIRNPLGFGLAAAAAAAKIVTLNLFLDGEVLSQ
jgi:hypothetical protein